MNLAILWEKPACAPFPSFLLALTSAIVDAFPAKQRVYIELLWCSGRASGSDRIGAKTDVMDAGRRYNPVEMISIRAIALNTLKDPLPPAAMPGKGAR
jgi:hypothetical protein